MPYYQVAIPVTASKLRPASHPHATQHIASALWGQEEELRQSSFISSPVH